jgi:hypothetical protein
LYFSRPHCIHSAAYATGIGALSLEVKWLGYEADQSPPSIAKVKETMELHRVIRKKKNSKYEIVLFHILF